MSNSILLGVNIDHVATVRNARGTVYPEPIYAALIAEEAGADGITAHLREDRRHIKDRDIELLVQLLQTRLNLEMAVTDEMLELAQRIQPAHCCLVPEKREEVTTEGGLDVVGQFNKVKAACDVLNKSNIEVSLFIDAEPEQIKAAKEAGASTIELHTGAYAEAHPGIKQYEQLELVEAGVDLGLGQSLIVNAGHGLHYHNVKPIAAIKGITELNIGHAIVARAVLIGFDAAVREMKQLMHDARLGL